MKVRTGSNFENIKHTSFTYILYGSEKWTLNSLTNTKNWSGRNEVTETSGRLHPLWPQNKWLHTPRTTDYRHTRQYRWIQTELAFTLAKNATKPNPFEIIPLQTTRKENIWKTEEALARAAVTLETERIKGSNPWCLWWWWKELRLIMLTQLSVEKREAPLLKLQQMSICGTLHDFVLVSYVPVSTEGNVVWSSNKIVCYTIE